MVANRTKEVCWFCKEESSDKESPHKLKLYKELDRTGSALLMNRTVHFLEMDINIERCSTCKRKHDSVDNDQLIVTSITMLIIASLGYLLAGGVGALFGFLLSFLIAFVVTKLLITNTHDYDFEQHPVYSYYLKRGWTIIMPDPKYISQPITVPKSKEEIIFEYTKRVKSGEFLIEDKANGRLSIVTSSDWDDIVNNKAEANFIRY